MNAHKYAKLFPMASEDELLTMAEDIKQRGLINKIILLNDEILDGRNRYEACTRAGIEPKYCEYTGTDPLGDVISWNLHRRHLTTSQRAALAVEIEPMFVEQAKKRQEASRAKKGEKIGTKAFPNLETPKEPIHSGKKAATVMKVSHGVVGDAKAIRAKSPELFEKIKSGDKTVNEAKKEIQAQVRQKIRTEIAKKADNVSVNDRWNVICTDFSLWNADKKYDYIITDPPYPREYLPVYEVLAQRAIDFIKPTGLVVVMCGQSYLDEIVFLMCKHLDYYWTAAYFTPGQPKPLRQRQVNCSWKPLLIFTLKKAEYKGKIFSDVFKSDNNDKELHKWGQSESGMSSIVSQICLKGESILDPFCGAGTTGMAAIKHGCFFTGLDIDLEQVNISKGRLYDAAQE